MTRKNVDFSVLSVLPVRATELDSVEAVDEWLQSAGSAERSRQVAAMSKDKLAKP